MCYNDILNFYEKKIMSDLLKKLKSAGTIKETDILSRSIFFTKNDVIPTKLPILNIAFSGSLDGGLVSGLTIFAGASKSFKTMLGLYCMKAYFEKYEDAVALFFDSEFGTTPKYVESMGINADRVLHIPIENVEQLKFDLVKRLEQIERKDHVFILIDSLGSIPSKKEVDDAMDEKSVADMTRAKAIRSLLRIVTPHLTTKDIPCIAINHVYQTMELYSKAVVGGGCVIEGTIIQMADGSLKQVQDICVGDNVRTLNGEKPVIHIWNPETLFDGEPECFEVEFEDGYKCTVSDNHPFLTDTGWVKAKDLTIDKIVVSI
jgi:hypothetical protein